MKVVIADDEALVRYSLRSMLDELALPLTVVAEASNGQELMQVVETHRPDIALVDVRMPGVTGLHAIRRARKAGARTRWIILTSHAEFDYASEAIQLGVEAYLLKPAGPAQLRAALEPLIEGIGRQRETEDAQFVQTLMLGLDAPRGAPRAALPACWAAVVRADFAAAVTPTERGARQEELVGSLRALAHGDARIAVWSAAAGEIRIVITEHGEAEGWHDAAVAFVKQASPFRRLSGAAAPGVASWEALAAAFTRCRAVLVHRGILGAGVFQDVEAWERRVSALPSGSRALGGTIEAFLTAWEAGRGPELIELVGMLTQRLAGSPGAEAAGGLLAYRTGLSVPAGGGWAARFSDAVLSAVPEVRKAVDAQIRVVEGVDDYLNSHMVDEVRVPDIAAFLALSPNYLSTLYRKTAGVTISERLTELRMLKARELLLQPGNAVKSVAAGVGYRSTRHFARLYRERFGHYPSGR